MILSGWEAVFFWIFAIAAIFAGLLTVMARNTVHSALFLISSLISVAALFILLGAEFIAGVQILVYVGGVMVLFLFVIMLVNVGLEERGAAPIFNHTTQVTASLIFCLLLVFGLLFAVNTGVQGLQARDHSKAEDPVEARARQDQNLDTAATGTSKITRSSEQVGAALYRYGSLPFEVASVLLLVAIIGSVMLARTIKQEAAVDDVAPEVLHEEIKRETELSNFERSAGEPVSEVNA
ncbi:MAG: NADH:ubiquinone oxidoreductase subunit 6 [Acidobacteria bacterium]|nr:NADH:ubiquinone oxidoreductase subunit 6 [Acidobacteriota bacterium]